jgi:hypothetical protein
MNNKSSYFNKKIHNVFSYKECEYKCNYNDNDTQNEVDILSFQTEDGDSDGGSNFLIGGAYIYEEEESDSIVNSKKQKQLQKFLNSCKNTSLYEKKQGCCLRLSHFNFQ